MSGLVGVAEAQREIRRLNNPLDLGKWSIFSHIDPQFLSTLKIAYVFGHDITTGFLVTEEDEVYSIGNNEHGRLGVGFESPAHSSFLLKVEALCGKKVSSFTSFSYPGNGNFYALTKSGQVYSWGYNKYGDLGLGTTTHTYVPTLVKGLRDKKVVQLSCGWGHGLALTSEGEAFTWGYNHRGQVGKGTTQNQMTPLKVSGVIGDIKISAVACGAHHCTALSRTGELFAWGHNEHGELGIGTKSDATTPVKLSFPQKEQVVKISCGLWHTMAITKSGKLYTWGSNDERQLGYGSSSSSTPIEIQHLGLAKDIAAINYFMLPICVCLTESKVYVWGDVWGNKLNRPEDTGLQTIEEALRIYSNPRVMHKPLVIESVGNISPNLTQDLEQAFNDEATTDVQFVSESESKTVHVHKSILEIRSTYFRTMFAGEWKESLESSLKIDSTISFKSFHALLFFLYTDKVEFPGDDFANILDLLKLADNYCESRLREQCEFILKRAITLQNAIGLYATASKHNAKELQDFAYEFILEHREEIPFKEGLVNVDLGIDDMRKLFIGVTGTK